MAPTRLSMALERGLLTFAQDPVLVNPPSDVDLPVSNAVQWHYPSYHALATRGFSVSPRIDQPCPAAAIFCERARKANLATLAQTLEVTAPGGLIAFEGAKTDGIDPLIKEIRARLHIIDSYAKAHGKLVWFERPAMLPDLSDWHAQSGEIEGGFATVPGIFSADKIDKGSAFLAEHLAQLSGEVADLGAGWGYLSRQILSFDKVTRLDLIEADHRALEMARLNIDDPRAHFIWGDATRHKGQYDAVVLNPPFHTSRKSEPALGQAFIAAAAKMLRPKGDAWIVANRNLPYEATLTELFGKVETVAQNGGFKVLHAFRPQKPH